MEFFCFNTFGTIIVKIYSVHNKINVLKFTLYLPQTNEKKTTYNTIGNHHANDLGPKGCFIWRR